MNDTTDPWTHRDAIYARTAERLKARTSAEWLDLLDSAGIWCGPVYGYDELLADPQIAHNGTFVEYEHPTEGQVRAPGFPIRFSKTPSDIRFGAPVTGQHSRDILSELGYSEDKIAALESAGAVHSGAL